MFKLTRDKGEEDKKRKVVIALTGRLEQMLSEDERHEGLQGGKAPTGQETNVSIRQLACQEEGCPDVETVILLSSKIRPKLMFKIYKAAADISDEELQERLEAERATAAQEATKDADGHGDGHTDAHGDGHGDAHGDGHGGSHEGEGHKHDGGCCGGERGGEHGDGHKHGDGHGDGHKH